MAVEVIMPRFGMTQEEGTIVNWIVKDGEYVEQGDPLCEVTTDKVNMEVEAPSDGILAGIRYSAGDTVPVTEVIAYILAEGESLPDEESKRKSITTGSGVLMQPPEFPGDGKRIKATPVARRMAMIEGLELTDIPGSGKDGTITRQDLEAFLSREGKEVWLQPAGGDVRATPAARRLAREGNIDLGQIKGSGPGGRIQGGDIQDAVQQLAHQGELPSRSAQVEDERVAGIPLQGSPPVVLKLQGIRRTIAERMQASWQTIPHITFSVDIDMGQAIAMRENMKARFSDELSPVSMTAVMVKACAAALRQHPRLNSYFRADEILLMPEVNVGVAVALEEGLIVPVVHQADLKPLIQIAQEIGDLSQRARSNRLGPQDVVDGTFTLSNLGMFAVDHFTAIINPPQVAILAMGRIAKRFIPDEAGNPVLQSMMTVTLSVDHRAVDGAEAARFLTTLRDILETAGAQWL